MSLTFRPWGSAEQSPWPGGNTDVVPTVWHLLIREEFARRAELGQLVCCNRDTAGWHGPGPSDWAAVFASSKSLALLEQRGIQDADPTADEKATGSQTPHPLLPRGCLAEATEEWRHGGWGRGRGGGQGSSPCGQCYLVGKSRQKQGERLTREGRSLQSAHYQLGSTCQRLLLQDHIESIQPPFEVGFRNFLLRKLRPEGLQLA